MKNPTTRRVRIVLAAVAVSSLLCGDAGAGARITRRIDLTAYDQPHAKMIPGDLDGDGRVDFLFTSGTRAARALTSDGELLWEITNPTGLPNAEPWHPWTSAVWDIDNDGAAEAIIFRKRGDEAKPYLAIVNGRDGTVERERQLWFVPSTKGHRRRGLLAVAYLRSRGAAARKVGTDGCPDAAAIVVGSDDTLNEVAAYDGRLEQLWHVTFERNGKADYAGHYIWPYDVDGDGLHELFVGKRLLDGGGRELWWMEDFGRDHVDSLACADIDPDIEGKEVVVCGATGARMYDASGRLVWRIPLKELRNPQRLVLGEFRRDLRGLETVVRERHSVRGRRALMFDCRGRILATASPLACSGRMQIDWDGDRTQDEMLGHEGNAGGIEDGRGRRVVEPAWYLGRGGSVDWKAWSPYPLAMDVTGDSREEIIQWGVRELLIATNDAPNPTPAPSLRKDRDYRLRYANVYMNRSSMYFDYGRGR